MIEVGAKAPAFELEDHLGRKVSLAQFAGKKHVMLLFYPLDFTPTWSSEIPGVERLQDRFSAAHTQVLGVSVDSKFCHAGWGLSLGGISYPLLADFQPKGALAQACGLYLDGPGITDRATVIIDANGVVTHSSSVGPGGQRDIEELAALCTKLDQDFDGTLPAAPKAPGLTGDHTLYVKSSCGFSAWTLQAIGNLHLGDKVTVKNVSDDAAAMAELKAAAGGEEKAPFLVAGGEGLGESTAIIEKLAAQATAL